MTERILSARSRLSRAGLMLREKEQVWLMSAAIFMALLVLKPAQGAESAVFVGRNLIDVAPFLVLSIGLAAYVGATGPDALIARAFTGSPAVMILLAAIAGDSRPSAPAASSR